MQTAKQEERVVIAAPLGQDAPSIARLLSSRGYITGICQSLGECCDAVRQGAGALLLTEEALVLPQLPVLLDLLKTQPPWSALPLIILTSSGQSRLARLLDMLATVAWGTTLLERPMSTTTLVRSVEVALNSRRRQYKVRDLLAEQSRKQRALEDANTKADKELGERKRAERKLSAALVEAEEGRQILHSLMEYIPEGIMIAHGPEVEIQLVSRYGVEMSGRDRSALDGIPASQHVAAWNVFHADGVTPARADELPLTRAARTGEIIRNEEWVIQSPNGTQLCCLCTAGPIRNGVGEISGGVVAWRDITERKQIEAALHKAQSELAQHAANLEAIVAERTAKLRETIEELESFSYSLSHDMRSPLRAMQGYAEALLEEYKHKLDRQAIHYLDRIQRAAYRLDLLIRDVLAYSRLAKGEINLVKVDLHNVVVDVLTNYPDLHPSKIKVHIISRLPPILGHEGFLAQVVSNLLGNAAKFTMPDVFPEVRISAEAEDDFVRFWFVDNGIGIAPQHHERIFQIFGRVYGEKQYGGTGIGLSIVKRAVERMGGSVGVESRLGQGSRFWITLRKAETPNH